MLFRRLSPITTRKVLNLVTRLSVRGMASRSYSDAVQCLNSQQSNAATLDAIRASGGRMNDVALSEMVEYLYRIGHSPDDLNSLNVIHITGTKGKGSTCAFCDSILREVLPGKKIGLYTSPHIVSVRERIRINGSPLSEKEFAKYFFEVWDLLEKKNQRALSTTALKPNYFRFLTLLAFHVFLSLKVDATILEVGIGGLYDSTNIVPRPFVTGISALGLDHVNILGHTISEIAFNKGGIFKKDVPAFTVEQPEEGMAVLERCALERQCSSLTKVSVIPDLSKIQLGIAGMHQRQNASLAIYLAHSFLRQTHPNTVGELAVPLNDAYVQGLQNARWPGRCQEVLDPNAATTTWFLDGSHTAESLAVGMEWFTTVSPSLKSDISRAHGCRILIFNCTSGRAGHQFLQIMTETITERLEARNVNIYPSAVFDHVIFCTNVTYTDGKFKPDFTSLAITDGALKLAVQTELAAAWTALYPEFPSDNLKVLPSIQDAIQVIRSLQGNNRPLEVLVCGSLHLVGGVIEVAGLADVALHV